MSKSGNAATATSGFEQGELAAGLTLNSAQASTASDSTVSNGVEQIMAAEVTFSSAPKDHSDSVTLSAETPRPASEGLLPQRCAAAGKTLSGS